jgi:hypothetical protein
MAYVFESKFFGEKPIKRDRAAITSVKSRQHCSRSTRPRSTWMSWASRFTGPSTAKAVAAFKQKRKILNYLNQIDDIVGIKTMQALDREMKRIDGGLDKKAVIKNAGHRHPYPRARPDLRGCREEDRRRSTLRRRAADRPFQQGSGVSRLSRQARAADSSAVEQRTPRSSVRTDDAAFDDKSDPAINSGVSSTRRTSSRRSGTISCLEKSSTARFRASSRKSS